MLKRLLVIFTLICVLQCKSLPSYSIEKLYTVLDQTSEYFRYLNNASNANKADIDNIINKYVEDTTKVFIHQLQKRSLQNDLQANKDVKVLQGFQETSPIDLPEFRDIAFFSMQDGQQLLRFAATVNSSNVLLYQFVNNTAQLLETYPLSNGIRIIVNSYRTSMMMVIQSDSDAIVILRLSKNESGVYQLQFKQEFEISGVVHINMWFGMNQLYLAIASDEKVSIYVWLGEHFDKIDTLYAGAKKLMSFQHRSVMHVVVVGSSTRIFRFSVRSNKFVETQKLHGSRDVSTFYFKEGHSVERFLVLADDSSTVFYKELYNRFVPFQKIAPTKYVHSLMLNNTVLLLSVGEEDSAGVYQYDGWRFVKLHTKLSNAHEIRQVRVYEEDTLLIQNQDGDWRFLKSIWIIRKAWQSSQNEIGVWCSEIKRKASQRGIEKGFEIPKLRVPVNISNAHIGHLRAQNINDQNATELVRLTQQYEKIIDKLNLTNDILTQRISDKTPKYTVLHAKKVALKCKTKCYVHRLITDTEIKFANEFRKLKSTNQTLEFRNLKVNTTNNWKCPVPNFRVGDIFVKKTINGILMKSLEEETLKTSGEQKISGEHTFVNLSAMNISIPLNIATNKTKQMVVMKDARVEELNLNDGEFFLPLNGSTTTMTGSLTAANVKITGLLNLKGKVNEGREKLMLLKDIIKPLTLWKNCFLQNVTFRKLVRVKNIVRDHGLSLKNILQNTISLDSNITERLILSSNTTHWNNVTLLDYRNWVTKNSSDVIIISGVKFASNNIVVTNATYEKLPIPKLMVPLCVMEVVAEEIRTSSITMNDIIVKNLDVSNVLGAYNINSTIFDSVSALQSIDFSKKLFTGQVLVKNISVSKIKGTDIKDFKIKWTNVDHIKGPINITKLVVNNLETPVVFNLSLPMEVKNVIVKANSNIGKINNVNISSFMENVKKVNDIISLDQVTFVRGLESNHVHTLHSTLVFPNLHADLNLHSKQISKTLEAKAINIQQTFDYVTSDMPSTFFVQGTVRFAKEPTVQDIGDVRLKKLFEDLWMSDQPAIVSGSNMTLQNITMKHIIHIYYTENSLNLYEWRDLSSKLFSKTKQQNITVASSFKDIVVPAVIAEESSTLQTSDLNLEDLLVNSFVINKTQIVDATWHFEELHIDNLYWDGKFNDMDLNTDVVRYDTEQNIIIGKKTIFDLSTKDLWPYNRNFSIFVNNALTKNCRKLSVIKGQKTFHNISLNNLSVKGTIMGHHIEEILLKSTNQTIFGIKMIQGQFNAPSFIIDGTVNDVNLTQLMNIQIKKHKEIQTIETEVDFKNNFKIFGNAIFGKPYEEAELIDIYNHNELNVLNRVTDIVELASNLTNMLYNSAIYVNKFEEVDQDILNVTLESDTIASNNTCLCEPKNISSLCNNTQLLNGLAGTNSSTLKMMKLVLLNDTVFVVVVSSNFVSIYTYGALEQALYTEAELHIPNILEASVEPADNVLWIILRLPQQSLVLHYQVWGEFKQYVLPASDAVLTSTTPNNQHLLIRSDGIWNLAGAFHPEHIFKMPLNGEIKAFTFGADYYVKVMKENNTVVFMARYVGN